MSFEAGEECEHTLALEKRLVVVEAELRRARALIESIRTADADTCQWSDFGRVVRSLVRGYRLTEPL